MVEATPAQAKRKDFSGESVIVLTALHTLSKHIHTVITTQFETPEFRESIKDNLGQSEL